RAFGIARSAQKKWCRGKIDYPLDSELAFHSLQARNPDSCSLLILLGFLLFFSLQIGCVSLSRLFAVTVVSFVVEDKDALESHQIGHDPLNHLPFSFERF